METLYFCTTLRVFFFFCFFECSLTDPLGRFDSEALTNFMSLIRYVQDETSLSALSSASKATSDVGDSGQDPGKRPSDRIKGNGRMKTKGTRGRRE